jgi:hypothetical protein
VRDLFSVEERDSVRRRLLELADEDTRVVAGAEVGAMASGPPDRWSDLDLTFGVADGAPLAEVLEDWTRDLTDGFKAVHLFDLPAGPTIYRVFLLPGCLQVDLSFTPASEFGARGPRFALLFGSAVEKPHVPPPSAHHLFGMGVHHAVRARFCIERGRLWQAEYWISALRDYALTLACSRRGLDTSYGRGFDQLPGEVLDGLMESLVCRVERDDLLRALGRAVAALLRESDQVREVAARVEPDLRRLTGA